MATILNDIRDTLLSRQQIEERKQVIAALEVGKLALRAGALAITLLAVTSPSLCTLSLLGLGYLNIEWSFMASNLQEIIEDFSTEISVTLSRSACKKQIFQNAPLNQSLFKIASASV